MAADAAGRRARRAGRAAALLAVAAALGGPVAAQAPPGAGMVTACEGCHGPNGNAADPLMPSIAGQPRVFIENQLVLIREGLRDVPTMKAVMGTLTDPDIQALARHFSVQAAVPGPLQVRPAERLRGAELSRRALCGTCHLADYTGQNQVPRLAGQNEGYLLYSLKQFRDHPGPGRDTIMSSTLTGMSDGDLAALAHYLAGSRP